jgi:hypothetical protein
VYTDELTYWRGSLSANQLQQEVLGFWADLDASPELQAALRQADVDPKELEAIEPANRITVRVDSSGVDAIAALILTLAPTTNRILRDVWTVVLLPRIRQRWGYDAVGDEVERTDR